MARQITNEMKRKAWEYGSLSKEHYNVLTAEQKKAFWEYGQTNKLYDSSKLDDFKKSEYNTYLGAPKTEPVKQLKLNESRPSAISGGRPMPTFDQKKLDKSSGTAGAFTANLVDSATLGLATKGLNKIEKGLGDKALADASKGHKVASITGNLAGYTVPFGAASKLAKPAVNLATKKISNQAAKWVVEQAGKGIFEGAMVGGAEAGIKGKNVKDSMIDMALLGAGGNLAIGGAGKLIGKVLKPRNLSPEAINVEQSPIATQNTTNPNIKPASSGKQNTSKFYSNSLMQGNVLTKEGKKALDETQYIYNVKNNEGSLQRAQDLINANGVENETSRLMASGLNSAEDSMTHYLVTKDLMAKASQTGDFTQLNHFLETTRPSITNAGQTIQALSQFKKTTPEGALMSAHGVVDNVVKEIKKTNPAKFEKAMEKIKNLPQDANFEQAKNKILQDHGIPTLSNDETRFIVDTMSNAQSLTGRAKDIEIAKVMQLIGDKVPADLATKVKALQRISLLLNTKTMTRNVLGNVILGGLENTKDIVGAPLDILTSKFTNQRTTGFPGLITQAKGLKQGAIELAEDARLGIDTSPTRGQYEIPQGRVFNNKILNALDKTTKYGLQAGDRPFYQAAYNDRLKQLMKFGNVTEPTQKMIDDAIEFAKDRTFQNESNIAIGMKKLQEGLNNLTGNKDIGIGTFAVPFTKTPANILDKAIEYSPIGIAKAGKQLSNASKGTFNQKAFIDNIARGTTGTGLIMAGYELAKSGYLMGGQNKDKDVAALQKQTGASPYSIKVGNEYVTVDWAQPSAVPLMIGADIYHGGKDRKQAESIILDAVKSGGETLFKQSLLQGMQKLFGGNTPLQGVEDVAKSIPSQFVPSLFKQAAQALDGKQRETYAPTTSGYIANSVLSKLPGGSSTLQPKVDTLGREVDLYQGKNSPFNILVNPSFTTTDKSSAGEKMALDIYNKIGTKNQFPRVAPKTVNGTPLTQKQFTDLQKEMGKRTLDMLDNLAKNVNIDNMSESQLERLSEMIESRLTKIQTLSKKKVLPIEIWKKR